MSTRRIVSLVLVISAASFACEPPSGGDGSASPAPNAPVADVTPSGCVAPNGGSLYVAPETALDGITTHDVYVDAARNEAHDPAGTRARWCVTLKNTGPDPWAGMYVRIVGNNGLNMFPEGLSSAQIIGFGQTMRRAARNTDPGANLNREATFLITTPDNRQVKSTTVKPGESIQVELNSGCFTDNSGLQCSYHLEVEPIAGARSYQIVDLGLGKIPNGVNDDGEVVGIDPTHTGTAHGFYWKDGAQKTIDAGGTASNYVYGISPNGEIVGHLTNMTTSDPAVPGIECGGDMFAMSGPDGQAVHLTTTINDSKICIYGVPSAVNARGTISGFETNQRTPDEPTQHAILVTADGVVDLLPSSCPNNACALSTATAVSSKDHAAGYVEFAVPSPVRRRQAFFWDGTPTMLAPLAGLDSSLAWGVNASDWVIGDSAPNAETIAGYEMSAHATLWTSGKAPIALDGLRNAKMSRAVAINDAGDIIGMSDEFGTVESMRAVMWLHVTDRAVDLNSGIDAPTTWKLSRVTAMSNDGHIVGTGSLNNEDGHAFMLVPVR
jgi:probable HAF family extracellular repeat protein